MTKAWVPNQFRNGAIVDAENVNDNLRAIERDIRRVGDLAYDYCTVVVPLDGTSQVDPAAARTIVFRTPSNLSTVVDVAGIELSIYAPVGATWTVTATDSAGRVEVILAATIDAATEALAASSRSLRLPITFVLSADVANVITRGSLVLTTRANRHIQDGGTRPSYSPTFIDATTSSSGSVLDAELTRAETATNADVAQNIDLRCECILARGAAAAQSWALPSGAGRDGVRAMLQVVATAAVTMTFSDGTNTLAVAGTGTGNTVLANLALASDIDNPTATADDLSYVLTPSASVALAYAFLWWR